VSFNDSDVTDVYLLYQNIMTIKTSLCLTTQICMVKFVVRLGGHPNIAIYNEMFSVPKDSNELSIRPRHKEKRKITVFFYS